MARPSQAVPSPPKPHGGRLRCWWRGRYWDLGRAGDRAAYAKYARLAALWATDPTAVEVGDDERLVSDLVADFLQSADSPRTTQRVRYQGLAKLFAENGGELPVREFGPLAFRAWLSWLAGLRRADGQSLYNVTSLRHWAGAVRRVFKWGVSTERVESTRYDSLRTVGLPKAAVRPSRAGDVRPADPAAVRAVLGKVSAPVRGMLELQLLTGARPSALCRMKVGELKRTGTADVPGVGRVDLDALGVWVYWPPEYAAVGKGKYRWLVFGDRAREVLRPFLVRRKPTDPVFDPRRADRREGRAGYARSPGKAYTASTYRQAVVRGCRRAGVPPFSPYDLRRLAAVEIDAGHGREAVAASLGHASIDTSAIYAKRNFTAAVRVARERG